MPRADKRLPQVVACHALWRATWHVLSAEARETLCWIQQGIVRHESRPMVCVSGSGGRVQERWPPRNRGWTRENVRRRGGHGAATCQKGKAPKPATKVARALIGWWVRTCKGHASWAGRPSLCQFIQPEQSLPTESQSLLKRHASRLPPRQPFPCSPLPLPAPRHPCCIQRDG